MKSSWKFIIIILLGVQTFVMVSIVSGIAILGWSQNVDQYKEKLEPWIFNYAEFSIQYTVVFAAALVIMIVVISLDKNTTKVMKGDYEK